MSFVGGQSWAEKHDTDVILRLRQSALPPFDSALGHRPRQHASRRVRLVAPLCDGTELSSIRRVFSSSFGTASDLRGCTIMRNGGVLALPGT